MDWIYHAYEIFAKWGTLHDQVLCILSTSMAWLIWHCTAMYPSFNAGSFHPIFCNSGQVYRWLYGASASLDGACTEVCLALVAFVIFICAGHNLTPKLQQLCEDVSKQVLATKEAVAYAKVGCTWWSICARVNLCLLAPASADCCATLQTFIHVNIAAISQQLHSTARDIVLSCLLARSNKVSA